MDIQKINRLNVFLCYASDDKVFARGLSKQLINEKIDVWFDENSLLPGQDWENEIRRAVRQADVVIICLSKQSINKEGYIQKEIRLALDVADEKPDGTIYIIPVRKEDCPVPERLTKLQWIDLFSSEVKVIKENYEKILKSLNVRIAQKEKGLTNITHKETVFIPSNSFSSPKRAWISPNYLNFLSNSKSLDIDETKIKSLAYELENTLSLLNAPARVVMIARGPRFIRFGVEPLFKRNKNAEDVRVSLSDIQSKSNDISLALAAKIVQIDYVQDSVKGYIAIDMLHNQSVDVNLLSIMRSEVYQKKHYVLPVVLGRDIVGMPVVLDISTSPNLLVGGMSNSGKTTCIQGCASSLFVSCSPNEVQVLFVDMKRIEFSAFSGIPHLISPVINDLSLVIPMLKWLLGQSNDRKILFSKSKVRNIDQYNTQANFEEKIPYIVLFISELSDLSSLKYKKVYELISAILNLSRITGIHIIATTQVLSSDFLIENIKQGFPNRIALKMSSALDSTNLIGRQGAEKLLGNGDMLFLGTGHNGLSRLQGVIVSDFEIDKLVTSWKAQIFE